MEYLIYPLLGSIAGLLAGLLGVGGGIVIVPVLVFTFSLLNFPEAILTHMAVGTSLATIVVTSMGSIFQHHKKAAVRWDIMVFLSVGLLAGALLGAEIAHWIQGRVLQLMFGVFAVIVAAQLAFGLKPPPQRDVPGGVGLGFTGVIIGSISSIFGIGGGSLMVPFLTWCNVKVQHAVGTSSAGGMPIAVAGAVGFMITGWGEEALPQWSLGYVYLPAFLGIAVTSIIFAQIGARFAHRLPATTLKKIFALLLVVVGVKMISG